MINNFENAMRFIKEHLPEPLQGGRYRQYTLAFLMVNYCKAVTMVAVKKPKVDTSAPKVDTSPKPNV